MYVYFFSLLLSVYKWVSNYFMKDDNALKLTLQEVVSHAVLRMESASEEKTRSCLFHDYKEWLGSSIDDWVLALPNDWGTSDSNFH